MKALIDGKIVKKGELSMVSSDDGVKFRTINRWFQPLNRNII